MARARRPLSSDLPERLQRSAAGPSRTCCRSCRTLALSRPRRRSVRWVFHGKDLVRPPAYDGYIALLLRIRKEERCDDDLVLDPSGLAIPVETKLQVVWDDGRGQAPDESKYRR